MKLNEKLKELRINNNLTQIELSKALEVTQASLCRWENGTHTPDAEIIIKYCKYFHVSADELLEL